MISLLLFRIGINYGIYPNGIPNLHMHRMGIEGYDPRRVGGFSSVGQHGRCRLGGPKGLFLYCNFLCSLFLDCGRKPEHPEETHANTGRMCKLHTDSDPRLKLNRVPGAVREQC